MNKKGFTLVELLSTLIILAIVSLIIYTSVKGISQKFRKDAYIESSKGVITAVTNYYSEKESSYFPAEGIDITSGIIKIENYQTYQSGKVYLSAENEFYLEDLYNGEFCAAGTLKNLVVTKGTCSNIKFDYIKQNLYVDYNYKDVTSGIIKNKVGNNYNGTLKNVSNSNGLLFAAGSKIETDSISNNDFTYEVVIKPTNLNNTGYLISNYEYINNKYNGCTLSLDKNKVSGACGFIGTNSNITKITSTQTISINKIYTLTYTYDGKNMKVFIDGKLVASKILEKIPSPSAGNLLLGQSYSSGSQYLGYIYSARIYDRCLTENEIKTNYKYNIKEFN